MGTTTRGITKLTIDKVILPKALFKQDITNNFFALKAKVLVGEVQLNMYELEMEIKVPINAYTAQHINSIDDLLIEIAPLQIEIPAYKTISFKKIDE